MNEENNDSTQDNKTKGEVWSTPPPPPEKEPVKSYDIPDTEGLTAGQAKSALGKISAEVLGDSQHPYIKKSHPQHGSFMETVTALHKIKNPESGPQTDEAGDELAIQPSAEMVGAMEKALDGQQAETDTAVEDAQELVDKLVADNDFEPFKVTPENVHLAPVWELQGHLQRENWSVLADGINKQLKENKQTPKVQQLFQTFMGADDLDTNLKKEMAHIILAWISAANKQRLGKK